MKTGTSDDGNDAASRSAPAFDLIVQGENDTIGLLAYGLHTQNEHEWSKIFLNKNHRRPNADEWSAFNLAEQMPSRLLTYRLMAETLLNQNKNCNSSASSLKSGSNLSDARIAPIPNSLLDPTQKAQSIRNILGMLALVVAMAVLFRLAGYYLFGTSEK